MVKINKEIVLLLINGSHSAFSKIYVKCHRQFFLLALRYLKSKEMAEDAVETAPEDPVDLPETTEETNE